MIDIGMKTFQDFLNERAHTFDMGRSQSMDPGIRSMYARSGVTPGNRSDFELLREIPLIALQAGPAARRDLQTFLQRIASVVPEVKPLVKRIGNLTAQDARDAKKLVNPDDIERGLGGHDEHPVAGEEEDDLSTDIPSDEDEIERSSEDEEDDIHHPPF